MAENEHNDQYDPENDQLPDRSADRLRASLRGKGREILLGEHADLIDDELVNVDPVMDEPGQSAAINANALSLTPEETDAMLDFSDSSLDIPLPEPDTPVPVEPDLAADLPDWWTDAGEAGDAGNLDEAAVTSLLDEEDTEVEAEETEHVISETVDGGEPPARATRRAVDDSVPLAERSAGVLANESTRAYQPHPHVEALNPNEPEIWWVEPHFDSMEHNGGVIIPEGAVIIEDPAPTGLPEPFEPVYQRQPAEKLFGATESSDPGLLHLLVDDDAIRKLAQQIETLQDELADHVRSDRDSADVYLKELLHASGLLMASRENYDDARAIVFRVRTDMKREEKVEEAISTFRPYILLYYTCWGIALGVLFFLKALFVGITDAVGVEAFAAMYNPMLFGIAGALISGYLTLERHTTKLRDFDPAHVSWYLFNPLLGAVMGLIMFLIAAIANEDLLDDAGSTAERAITDLLCVVAGMNQNNVLRQLNNLLERVNPGNGE